MAAISISFSAKALTMNELAGLSNEFEKKLSFKLPSKLKSNIESIVYGSSHVGYFEASDWKKTQTGIDVSIIPPSYMTKTEIIAKLSNGKSYLLQDDYFKSPLPPLFSNLKIEVEKGKLENSFYLLNGALPRRGLFNPNFSSLEPSFYKKNANRFTYLMIVNKLGEVVWAHVPVIDGALFGSYLSAKRVGDGYYGIMFGKHSGYFEVAKYDGEVVRDFSSRDAAKPFAMHHDFETIGSDKLYAVGNKIEDLYKFTKNPKHKGKTFLTDTLIGINLKKGTSKELKDFSSMFNPDITPYYTGDAPGDKKFAVWGKPKVDLDFLHINAVDYVKDKGVLVSFRNISKVALIDSKFNHVKWTLGSQPTDTFYIEKPEDRFLQQHTPVMLSDDVLMVFDNAAKTKHSRAVKYYLNRKNGKASKIWEFKSAEQFYSKDRSSVAVLPSGNYGVFYVNPKVRGSKSSVIPHRDYYYEVDQKTGRELARMKITYGVSSPGYRVLPISTIGRDKFLGERPNLNVSVKRQSKIRR